MSVIRNCKLSFQCDRDWDDLMEIEAEDDVRYCNSCDSAVYFCYTNEDLAKSIRLNRCVAVMSFDELGRQARVMGSPSVFPST
jgi:hypothetical protein